MTLERDFAGEIPTRDQDLDMTIVFIIIGAVVWVRWQAGQVSAFLLVTFLAAAAMAFVVVSIIGNRVLKSTMTRRHPIEAALWETVAMNSGPREAWAAMSTEVKGDRLLGVVTVVLSLARALVPIAIGAAVSYVALLGA